MSTVYDQPCPEPTEAEEEAFSELLADFLKLVHDRLGFVRGEVMLDAWHVGEVSDALTGEANRSSRILSDLNEELRLEQQICHVSQHGDETNFRPLVLVPKREP